MDRFYLEQLAIYGEGKTPSFIRFGKGLNIIHGVSNTGKTSIIKCIDFVFGSDNSEPIPLSDGYTKIVLSIITKNGKITLERNLHSKKTKLTSQDENFISGEYDKTSLGKVLLALLGIKNEVKIIKNSKYEKISLTLRTFIHSFIITEEEIIQTEPLLISKEATARTSSLSALLYLISAPNFDDITPKEDEKIRQARKMAVENYISAEISKLRDKAKNLEEIANSAEAFLYECNINTLAGELTIIENSIKEQNAEKGSLYAEFLEANRSMDELNLRLRKYDELMQQYLGDIERLGFIAEGDAKFCEIPLLKNCPFCKNELSSEEQVTYSDSLKSEKKRILKLVDELKETMEAEEKIKQDSEENIKKLDLRIKKINEVIEQSLKPQQKDIKERLEQYRKATEIKKELELTNKSILEKSEELSRLKNEKPEKVANYKPLDHFPIEFKSDFEEMFNTLLNECKYEDLREAKFDTNTFDAIINDKEKKNYGKGYRAFINTILALTLRKYLVEKGKFAPRLLIIDSPLLSLKQGVSDSAPESMKTALMKYLINTQNMGQSIIIENSIPKLDYEKYSVNLIKFTKRPNSGRYGLLEDVRN